MATSNKIIYVSMNGEKHNIDSLLYEYNTIGKLENKIAKERKLMRDTILGVMGDDHSLITQRMIATLSAQNRTGYNLPEDVEKKIEDLRGPFKIVTAIPVLKVTVR